MALVAAVFGGYVAYNSQIETMLNLYTNEVLYKQIKEEEVEEEENEEQ